MQLFIRKAKEEDYSSIAGLIQKELGYSALNAEEFYKRMEAMEAHPEHTTFVAVQGGEVVGFIGLLRGISYECEGDYFRIIALAVAKEMQGRGTGSALLRHAEQYAAETGVTAFALNSGLQRAAAHVFYERNGFRKKSYGFIKELPGSQER